MIVWKKKERNRPSQFAYRSDPRMKTPLIIITWIDEKKKEREYDKWQNTIDEKDQSEC